MGTEELLAIVGIILTIIAFISEKNRNYIFLKFSTLDKIILIFLFVLIHYLIVFDWIQENWFPYLSYFTFDKGIPSTVWSYIFTIVTIIFILYKIFYAFFPTENLKKVISHYNKLNLSMEHPYLLELIRAHHIEDIPIYFNRIKDIDVHAEPYDIQANDETDRAFRKAINTPRLIYANNVLFKIIDDEVFINHTVNVDPYFYTKIIQCLNTRSGDYSHIIERYLEILMQNKNYHFFKEIKNTLQLDTGGKYKLEENNEILFSLFSDIKVAELNYVWQPVANVAIWELKNQNSKESQFLKGANFEEQFDFELSNTKMKTAIHFFDIMIRESIYQKAECHMGLFSYHRFVKVLMANMPESYYDQDDHEPTLNHKLIHDIIENMLDWLDVGVKLKVDNLSIDICRCIGKCIYEITSSDILSDKVKIQPLDRLLKKYFDYGWDTKAEFQRLELEKTLLMPSDELKWGDQEENIEKYKNAINLAWQNFDKIPYSAYGGNISYNKFNQTLLGEINQI